MKNNVEISSFRDPSGYVYYHNNKVRRKINSCYFKEYHYFMSSGLYDELVEKHYIVAHKEISKNSKEIDIEVEKIPYISYPYEWTFDELKDAALLTLKINQIAMKYQMILKDASAYNIQFLNGKAIFIDTLSFMFYEEGMPWGAYGQFCRHFVAPLTLMQSLDVRLNGLLRNYIDGIPIDLCCNLLRHKGGSLGYFHLKLQNRSIKKHELDGHHKIKKVKIPRKSLLNMFQMLESQIHKLYLKKYSTEWMNYYDMTNYEKDALSRKEKIIREYCEKIHLSKEDLVFDLGANDGRFSYLSQEVLNSYVVSFDIDSNCVNKNYLYSRTNNLPILPLIMDINNPSSSIGFSNQERKSFMERGKAGLTLVLAFLHHMVISNNISFEMTCDFLSKTTHYLIIEFVPKEDSQVQILLQTREDIFLDYNIENFKRVFLKKFKILMETPIDNSQRTLFLMEVNDER